MSSAHRRALPQDRRLILARGLATDDTASRQARALLWRTMSALGVRRTVVSDAAVMLSELVVNALTHARSPYLLRISHTRVEIFCEVIDHGAGSVALPVDCAEARLVDSAELDLDVVIKGLSEGGRGLAIVTELSGGRCGSVSLTRAGQWPTGKSVWFAVPRGAPGPRGALAARPGDNPSVQDGVHERGGGGQAVEAEAAEGGFALR